MPQLSALPRGLGRPVQVIAVTGGKGGVGKTSVSVNLATALAQAGREVLLFDGDLGLANVDVLLGLTPKGTLEQVVRGEVQLRDVIVPTGQGVSVVPAASGISRMAELSSVEHAALIREFNQLPDNYDVLIVDTAAGIAGSVRSFTQAAQHVLVVVRNEPASLTDAYALIKVLHREHHINSFKVLVNMTQDNAEAEGLFRRLQSVTDRYLNVQLSYVGEIPDDQYLQKAIRTQRSVMEAYPGSRASLAFRRLAQASNRWPVPAGPSGRLEFFFERLLARPPARLQVAK
jgi:flagellar biosynthesis protein FlhG